MLSEQHELRLRAAIADITRDGAKCVYTHSITAPHRSDVVDIPPGTTLAELAPKEGLPVVCILNDEYVLRSDWNVVPTPGDLVMFVQQPLGSGGGSNALRVILQIVLVVVVAIFQPELLAAYGSYAGVASAAIIIAGNLLINLLLPIRGPSSNPGSADNGQSPTYNVTASGNQARLDAPIPSVYGRMQVFPDFVCQPYVEYVDNDQFYNAIFALGQGDYEIEAKMIDDTDISHFADVDVRIVPAGAGLPADFYIDPCVVNAPEVTGQTMNTQAIIGPFSACGPGNVTTHIEVDIVFPRGLYFANDDGTLGEKSGSWLSEARKINPKGKATGNWFLLGYETVSGATTTEIRKTYKYDVPKARYEVRITRQDVYDDNSRAGHVINWAGLRTFLADVDRTLEPSVTYAGVRMRASDQLNSLTQRKFAFIIRRKLFTWTPGSGWSSETTYTRNAAWVAADILRNTVYGGKIPDNRIDLQTLYDLSVRFDDRRDYFDATFDNVTTLWDALGQVMKSCRTARYMRNGIFTFVRDEAQTVPRAMFSGRNILKGSFQMNYITPTEETPDGITIQFYNSDIWDYTYLTIPSPGVTVPDNPQQVLLYGVSNLDQATREGQYTVAADRYRRRTVSFGTEMDGFIPTYGDLIAISYDLPSWGATSGDVTYYDGATGAIQVSEALDFSSGLPCYIAFTTELGEVVGPFKVNSGADPFSATIDPSTPVSGVDIYFGYQRERTRFTFGPATNLYRLARVLSVTPRDTLSVDISAVIEDQRVHDADGNPTGGAGGDILARIAHYSPDGIPTYDSATSLQRNKYGFYAKDTGLVGTANDPGYKYDDS